jgi:hypothetical protein
MDLFEAPEAPSQRLVRPEVMAAYRRTNEKYRELYKRLAKSWPSAPT